MKTLQSEGLPDSTQNVRLQNKVLNGNKTGLTYVRAKFFSSHRLIDPILQDREHIYGFFSLNMLRFYLKDILFQQFGYYPDSDDQEWANKQQNTFKKVKRQEATANADGCSCRQAMILNIFR